MGSLLTKGVPDLDAVTEKQIDNPDDLPAKLIIGSNVVICQAAVNPSGDTVVALVTPNNVLARQLTVTSNSSFAAVLRCGESKKDGQPMEGPNKDLKHATKNFGKDGVVAIQFLKKTQHDECCESFKPNQYGTILIPKSLKGYLIVFFWPEDYEGDGYRNFRLEYSNTLAQEDGRVIVKEHEHMFPGCALKTNDEAVQLRAVFGL